MRRDRFRRDIKVFAVLKWFNKTLFGRTQSDLLDEQDAQNDRMKTIQRQWQAQWHDLFDEDDELVALGEFARPEPLPEEISCDFRLVFGLSRATCATREKCFSLFPSGKEMQRRFDDFLISKPIEISETEARARLNRVAKLMQAFGSNLGANFSEVRVVNRETQEGFIELSHADPVTILLEREAQQCSSAEELPKVAARSFLSETLYAAAGNYYELRNWVTAAMDGGLQEKLHSELYELWSGGWQVVLGRGHLILASRTI